MVSQTHWIHALFASVALGAVAGVVLPVDTDIGCCQYFGSATVPILGTASSQDCNNKPQSSCVAPGDKFTANAKCSDSPGPFTCQSTGFSGDPVMVGFDNVAFEFFGKPYFNYSVLATASLDVNMQLVPAGAGHIRHQGGEGTVTRQKLTSLSCLRGFSRFLGV